jgi:hypothetical protein
MILKVNQIFYSAYTEDYFNSATVNSEFTATKTKNYSFGN